MTPVKRSISVDEDQFTLYKAPTALHNHKENNTYSPNKNL